VGARRSAVRPTVVCRTRLAGRFAESAAATPGQQLSLRRTASSQLESPGAERQESQRSVPQSSLPFCVCVCVCVSCLSIVSDARWSGSIQHPCVSLLRCATGLVGGGGGFQPSRPRSDGPTASLAPPTANSNSSRTPITPSP
jgi:hypothetical protein